MKRRSHPQTLVDSWSLLWRRWHWDAVNEVQLLLLVWTTFQTKVPRRMHLMFAVWYGLYILSNKNGDSRLETTTLCYKYETKRAYSRPCTQKQIEQTWASFRLLFDLIPRWHPYQRQFILWLVKKNGIFSGFCAWPLVYGLVQKGSETSFRDNDRRSSVWSLKVFECVETVRFWPVWDFGVETTSGLLSSFWHRCYPTPPPSPHSFVSLCPAPHPVCWSNCSLLPVYIPKAEKFYGCGFSLFFPLWVPEIRRQRETVQRSAKFTTEENV